MLPSVLFSLQLIKFNQKCTHTSTKGIKGLKLVKKKIALVNKHISITLYSCMSRLN